MSKDALDHGRLLNWGAAMSRGQIAGDIPGLVVGVNRLGRAVCRDLFGADQQRFCEALLVHAEPELRDTRYYVPAARS